MKVKEAIERLNSRVLFNGDYGFVNEEVLIELDTLEASEIIALLKRGEKYKAMWKKFKKFFNLMIAFKRGTFEHLEKLEIFIKDIEQKYFPKGDD